MLSIDELKGGCYIMQGDVSSGPTTGCSLLKSRAEVNNRRNRRKQPRTDWGAVVVFWKQTKHRHKPPGCGRWCFCLCSCVQWWAWSRWEQRWRLWSCAVESSWGLSSTPVEAPVGGDSSPSQTWRVRQFIFFYSETQKPQIMWMYKKETQTE